MIELCVQVVMGRTQDNHDLKTSLAINLRTGTLVQVSRLRLASQSWV